MAKEKPLFTKGGKPGPGRPVGSKDQYTRIKEMICDVLERRQGELEDLKLNDILQFVGKTVPKETKIEVVKPIVVSWEKPKE